MPKAEGRTAPGDLQLTVSRLLSAPPAVVWRAWTDPRQIERWWHPAGFRRPVCEGLDLRVGGGFRIVMQGQDGAVYAAWGIYREIVSERKLAYDGRCDKDGQTFHAATEVVTFAPEGAAATRVTIDTAIDLAAYAGTGFTTPMITQGWTEGWEQNLAGLATLLSGPGAVSPPKEPLAERQIVNVRVLDAPRTLVWQVWTDPKHITRWWGPRGFSTTTKSMDLRPGGSWVFVMHGPDGTDFGNKVTFIEVDEPRRLVYRHEGTDEGTEATKDVTFLSTVTFVEKGDKTEVTLSAEFPSKAERDFVADNYGAVEGGRQTLERLGEHIASLLGGERRA